MKFSFGPSYWAPCFVLDHCGDNKTRRYTGVSFGPCFIGFVRNL